jgi:integrase
MRPTATLAALAARHLCVQHTRTKPSTYREESRLWQRTLLPAFGASTLLAELVRETAAGADGRIDRWFAELAVKPYLANRALNSLAHAFALAERLRWVPADSNPCRGIRRYPERARLRYPDRSELERLDAALARLLAAGAVTDASADAIQALALTGRRRNEILRLAWRPGTSGARGWVDLGEGVLRLEDTKTGPQDVPLSRCALELFQRRAHARDASPWVFPSSRRQSEPLAGLQRAWERACGAAGIAGACIHSLRHSFATRALEAGVDSRLVMGLLGHRDRRSLDRYQHPTIAALRRAADALDEVTTVTA